MSGEIKKLVVQTERIMLSLSSSGSCSMKFKGESEKAKIADVLRLLETGPCSLHSGRFVVIKMLYELVSVWRNYQLLLEVRKLRFLSNATLEFSHFPFLNSWGSNRQPERFWMWTWAESSIPQANDAFPIFRFPFHFRKFSRLTFSGEIWPFSGKNFIFILKNFWWLV